MDFEFHYYMTYLIAARAGFDPHDARLLAYSSQFIDDNDMVLEIDKGKSSAYGNYISQTMNILKPKRELFRIYPLFHFIPGDPKARTAWRKDGKMHWLCTTPDSRNANAIMDDAIKSKNVYRIGIAAHGYADTWAHQNFTGYYEDFNAMDTALGFIAPNIGHADAGHNPDEPALCWRDPRLLSEAVDNKARFLDAARQLYGKFARFVDPKISDAVLKRTQRALSRDLSKAIGGRDQTNNGSPTRVSRYLELARRPNYGGCDLPKYEEDQWFSEAVNEDVRGFRDRSDNPLLRFDPLTDRYTWKSGRRYKQSHWYRFQEAIKTQQEHAWNILRRSNLKGLAWGNW